MAFDNVIRQQQINNNILVNESERNDTISSTIPNSSVFDKSFQQATTFNSGKAVPVLLQEVYPGDIYEIDINSLIRLSSPASTPLVNINYDINFFFVPYSQIDKEFKQLMGENNDYGYSDTNIKFPKLKVDNDFSYNENDLANYFNVPINKNYNGDELNLYPFLAYGKVWNEWYRDQNLQSSINITSCFNEQRELNTSTYKTNMSFYESLIYGKGLAPTSKLPSFYTTNLPYQQKGLPISLPANLSNLIITNDSNKTNLFSPNWFKANGDPEANALLLQSEPNSNGTMFSQQISSNNYGNAYLALKATGDNILPTINDLRYSIVSQHLLENFALCGSRYVEQLKSIWGIEIDPKNINRTELIGGVNESLIYNNVMQTSQTTEASQLGKIATNLYNSVNIPRISYASSQHGFILGILTLRTTINNGAQGLPKLFSYDNYLDLFNPLFNGIGEQPTLNKELYYNDIDREQNDKTFGFNEPFLSTKYNIDNANGFLSLNSKTSLFALFLFGEKYEDTPLLSDKWIQYDSNIISNTLYKVDNENLEFYHQFIALFSFKITYTTKQPLFNSPRVYGI